MNSDFEPGPRAYHPLARAWLGFAAIWLLWGAISSLRLLAVPEFGWSEAFWYGFPDAVIWAALTPLLVVIARRVPVRRPRLAKALAFHLAAALGFAVLHAALDAGVAVVRGLVVGGEETFWTLVFVKVFSYGFQTNLLVYTLVVGLVQYVDRVRSLADGERRAAELEAQLAEARLAGLERQLRPHFLFNALNTVSGLMGSDPETGRRVVRHLGDLLRASLKNQGRQISLGEELDLVRAYLEIEQARFEDHLQVEIDADPSLLGYPMPALILQPLVENAITHGISRRPDGGHLRIAAERRGDELLLTVEDDGPGTEAPVEDTNGFGLGLENTRQRLRALYGEGDYLTLHPAGREGEEKGGLRVSLRLPRGTEEVEP